MPSIVRQKFFKNPKNESEYKMIEVVCMLNGAMLATIGWIFYVDRNFSKIEKVPTGENFSKIENAPAGSRVDPWDPRWADGWVDPDGEEVDNADPAIVSFLNGRLSTYPLVFRDELDSPEPGDPNHWTNDPLTDDDQAERACSCFLCDPDFEM